MKRTIIEKQIRAKIASRRGESGLRARMRAWFENRPAREAAVRAMISFAMGFAFAIGLGVAGMTKPSKVIGFLDVLGPWDPTLAIVVATAVGIDMIAFYWILSRQAPLFADDFELPANRAIDARLLSGAVLFGIGWGASGYCPGPAIVSLVTFSPQVIIFFSSMIAGMMIWEIALAPSEPHE